MSDMQFSDYKGKFIFITGGVVSSLGKGVLCSSIALLLSSRGFKVNVKKLDPYLNVNPGTMSPLQHGEVFVTEDGAETDLDLGHYERFTNINATKADSITAGKVYLDLIAGERDGKYLGMTVQVVPHVTDLIKKFLLHKSAEYDFVICEIGGTVGDIEGQPFFEAIRQMGYEDSGKALYIHLTLVPYIDHSSENKSKPTQHSTKELRAMGINPDIIICRVSQDLSTEDYRKIALFCNVKEDSVVTTPDVKNIYSLPLIYHEKQLDMRILEKFGIEGQYANLSMWNEILAKFNSAKKKVSVAIVGKYTSCKDAYKSLVEAIGHGGMSNSAIIDLLMIDSVSVLKENVDTLFSEVEGIIIPGGFGIRGTEGKIYAIEYARKNNIPILGICFGLHMMAIEIARNLCKLPSANSLELNPESETPVIKHRDASTIMETGVFDSNNDGTMRLGACTSILSGSNSLCRDIYGTLSIIERHRHRYEVNHEYIQRMEECGFIVTAVSDDDKGVIEIMEYKHHPWFIGVQFHPEFKSRPIAPHPIFCAFIKQALKRPEG